MWFVLMGETHGSYNSVCLRIGCDIKQQPHVSTQWDVLAAVAFLGVLSGLVASVFAWLTHTISKVCARFIRDVRIRPFVGGLLVIGLRYAVGSTDYLGLGAYAPSSHYDGVSISSAFRSGGAQPYSWVLKLLFTCLSLGTGFKGGEVTPLFFIGATLGNAFAWMLGRSSDMVGFYAAIGFVAVFAGATNTPIACAVMGIELFGGNHFLYVAVSCIVAFLSSAEASIYDSQQMSMFAKLSVLPLEVGLFKRQKEKANSSDAGCSEPPNTV
jgi:H+/Cl- antiporter ClcA